MLRFLFSFLFLFFVVNPELQALWEKEEIKEIQKKLQNKESFYEKGITNGQVLHIELEDGYYAIDFKARHCVRVIREVNTIDEENAKFSSTVAALPVPCKKIKKGYPLFAPLLKWAR